MDNKKNLIKNILSIGIVQIANYLLPLISIPIIVRIIGPSSYGVINYYGSFTAYFILLINYGFEYTGTRFIAVQNGDVDRINEHFTKILYAKILLFLVSVVVFSIFLSIVSKSISETKVAIYTFLVTISMVLSPNWFYQGMQQLTKVALFNFISKIVFTVAVLLIVRQQSDYIWQPLILSLTQIIVSIVSLMFAIKKFKIRIGRIDKKAISLLLWEDRTIFFTLIASNLYTDTNIVILGLYESKEHVGYFSAAWKLIFVFLMIISFPLSQAMFPYIAKSFSENINKGIDQIKRALPFIIYFTLFSSVILYGLSHIIIFGFYGAKFGKAVTIFRILTLVPVLSYINTMLGLQTMVNLKMDKPYFKIILFGGVFSVLFNIIVISNWGYVGCAWSWVITEIIIAFCAYIHLRNSGYDLFEPKYFSLSCLYTQTSLFLNSWKKKS